MKKELLFSGIGGQGVITLGEALCDAAIKAGFNVTFVPFYGQEKRGGIMCKLLRGGRLALILETEKP